jgi:hypothetical protein
MVGSERQLDAAVADLSTPPSMATRTIARCQHKVVAFESCYRPSSALGAFLVSLKTHPEDTIRARGRTEIGSLPR